MASSPWLFGGLQWEPPDTNMALSNDHHCAFLQNRPMLFKHADQ